MQYNIDLPSLFCAFFFLLSGSYSFTAQLYGRTNDQGLLFWVMVNGQNRRLVRENGAHGISDGSAASTFILHLKVGDKVSIKNFSYGSEHFCGHNANGEHSWFTGYLLWE